MSNFGAVILGVSRDTIGSHEKFRDKLELPFHLLSDTDGKVCQLYGVLKEEKKAYDKKTIGIERTTFIIDNNGKCQSIFRKFKIEGHVAEVINELRRISKK